MSTAPALPIVDISLFGKNDAGRAIVSSEVRHALENVGFLYVRGLPLAPAQVDRAFATSRRFFESPPGLKRQHAYASVDANFGYQGLEVESLDTSAPPDLKESFTMRNALAVQNQVAWPDEEFRREAVAFYAASLMAAYRMLQIMAASLALPADFFAERHLGQNVSLRFLHYPTNLAPRAHTQLGAGAHTDYGSITLLFQDEVGGLEVRGLDGQWRAAPRVPGCTLINTGDLMERWTNGRFRSTPHRVLPVSGARDRYSIALFVDPDSAVNVECIPGCAAAGEAPRHPPISAGEHIRERIAASHVGRS
ncbi:MAG: 2OG-Fe(II) oxygenase family protein [Steroidobacteraceae bacterium]